MWADVNSKPLQGTLFKIMRDKMMNYGVDYEDMYWAEQPAVAKKQNPKGPHEQQLARSPLAEDGDDKVERHENKHKDEQEIKQPDEEYHELWVDS